MKAASYSLVEHLVSRLEAAERERIACVAIRHVDGGVFMAPRPKRHHDVIRAMGPRFAERRSEGHEQGFLTSTGRFVDRVEAKEIAVAAGQFVLRAGRTTPMQRELFSEDLW